MTCTKQAAITSCCRPPSPAASTSCIALTKVLQLQNLFLKTTEAAGDLLTTTVLLSPNPSLSSQQRRRNLRASISEKPKFPILQNKSVQNTNEFQRRRKKDFKASHFFVSPPTSQLSLRIPKSTT
jgi:hypothetical protein